MPKQLNQRKLGDLSVSAVGMGAMTLTQTLEHDPSKAVTVVAAAIEAGVTLFDTADSYGPTGEMGVNETALIRALNEIPGAREGSIIATKAGHTRGPAATWWIDGRPEYIADAARASLKRLGVESIQLYQHHRPDPKVPYAESMGAFKTLVEEGIVQRVGISNVDIGQIDVAKSILGENLVSVQNEFSAAERSNSDVLAHCEKLGLAFLAYSPLGGMRHAKSLTSEIESFAEVARARGVSPQQVAIAWLLAKSPNMIPIPGASRPESVQDSAAAVNLELSPEELALLNELSKAVRQD